MRAKFTVTTTEGVQVGTTTALSSVETERRFSTAEKRVGVTSLFIGDEPLTEALYWLMWRSLHPAAARDDDETFLAWLPTVLSYSVEEGVLPPPPPGG